MSSIGLGSKVVFKEKLEAAAVSVVAGKRDSA